MEIFGILFFIILVALYFIPFIIAIIRRINNSMPVFFLNLFLGWTVVGFFVLIFYASLTNVKSTESIGEFIKKKKKKKKKKKINK
tara:strand:- start:327 stop:581 length:255 start_codon:yes stop_codon:yes gene_type:complete